MVHRILSLKFVNFKKSVIVADINYNSTKFKQSWPNKAYKKPIS